MTQARQRLLCRLDRTQGHRVDDLGEVKSCLLPLSLQKVGDDLLDGIPLRRQAMGSTIKGVAQAVGPAEPAFGRPVVHAYAICRGTLGNPLSLDPRQRYAGLETMRSRLFHDSGSKVVMQRGPRLWMAAAERRTFAGSGSLHGRLQEPVHLDDHSFHRIELAQNRVGADFLGKLEIIDIIESRRT